MAPIVHGLEEFYEGEVNFIYLDIDDPATTDFKRQFGYRYQPEYYLIGPDGEVLNAWFGFVPPEAFIEIIDEAVAAY